MPSHISASIRWLLSGICHLWVSSRVCDDHKNSPPGDVTFFVYSKDFQWGQELLAGKRIRVTLQVEDWRPQMFSLESEEELTR